MTEKNYVALHNHSDYSTLDGFATVDEYIKAAKKNNMIGIGLSDHGSASGLYKFITRAQKEGLIPVPGVEFYLAPENPAGAKVKEPVYYSKNGAASKYDLSNGAYTHITVFAYNNKGLFNLFKLSSLSWEPQHFYFKPRIDTNMLAEYSEGLIVTTGCPGSEINKRFLLGQDDKAYEFASRLKSIFEDNFYVEIMDHKMPDDEIERIIVPKLIELSRKLDIPPIITNDSHYAFKEDSEPHERVLAVSTRSTMKEPPVYKGGKRFSFSTPEYYIKTYDEMIKAFPGDFGEQALANTVELTMKCKDIKLGYDPHLRPEIDIPEGYTPATYLQELIYEGFKKKRGHSPKEIQEESVKRIQEEFRVIHSNDFISYFLVVRDYINYAHEKGIGVGAGRGCFVPGTKVKANQGTMRNIEDIKIGDKVQTHDTTYQLVEDVFTYDVENEDMIRLTLSNGKIIECTSDHMIFHKQEGFIEAKEFKIGDIVLGPKGRREKYNIKCDSCNSEIIVDKQEYDKKLLNQNGKFISHQQNKKEIYYASSYEKRTLSILETDSDVKYFDRCRDVIPYVKPSTGLIHNYLPDFEVIDKNGDITVIEVKAKWQLEEEDTKSKLQQAKEYYNKKGVNYVIWTEDTLNALNDDWHNDIEVINVEKFTYTGKVHDIQVSNVHNYNVEGVTVHNSVGGSEIAYVLDISNTDPIRFDLLFERFLSPGRGALYNIEYMSGESEEVAVSDKKRVYFDDGNDKVLYIHELNPGDLVNYGNDKEVIKDVYVTKPGSAPDIDTDLHTEGREEVIKYIVGKYGEENVANIVTFGTFKAKRAFKAMCTIYDVPFSAANKASSYIPGNQGAEASLDEIMDPTSPRYNEGVDFRRATEGEMFDEVVDMASKLDGRISETGIHPCGIIISSEPLAGIIPTQVRQSDGKVVTQWEYPELESLGLIKMDLLGLELINTVQQTLENIRLTNESATNENEIREIPDMKKIIQGEMNDSATYKMLQEGNTVGIFQLGSPGVRELLRRAKPNDFMDIATITALYRPGPMSMNSHLEWADRKNGAKEIVSIDEKLKGTVVEDILSDTAGVLVFQESLMQIATRYAGMTSYESDLLRKAMGKKKIDLMMSLKPKFIEGAIDNGSTKKLAEKVWETMEGFASYGFNKCTSGRTLVNTKDGKRRIEDLYKEQEESGKDIYIESMFEDGSIRQHKVSKIVKTGRKPLYKIKTKQGKHIYITKEHRLLTTNGYGSIEDGKLVVGEELIVDEDWNKKISKKARETRKNNMSELNKRELKANGNYIGYRNPTQLSNGEWCDSMVEALAGEYLLERGIDFELHKIIENDVNGTNRKVCDFYVNGLYFEMDGMRRGRQYFIDNKYGEDIPFVYMTPENFGDVIDEAIMNHHIKNGDEIVEIIPPKIGKNGKQYTNMTYDIEMCTSGPANFIANGIVSHNSHSVSYAINIYEAMYLKTHYPSEFMAAVIQQGIGDPNKVKIYIQEAKRMKLRLGPVDINNSQVQMASTGINKNNKYDIVFGFSGVKQMNENLAMKIVEERNENGPYESVADFVKRVSKKTQLTSSPLSNLARAGAFDSFGVSRKLVSDKARMIIESGVKQVDKGVSLFDMLGPSSTVNNVTESIEIKGEDYDYNEMIKLEADVIGMYVSGHPTSKLGHIARIYNSKDLKTIFSSGGSKETFNVLGTITQIASKTNRSGNKSIAILIDDGNDTATSYLPRNIVQSIEKGEELIRIQKAKEKGVKLKETKHSEKMKEILMDETIKPMEPIEINDPYLFKLKTRGWGDNLRISVVDIVKLDTAPDGSLPYEINVEKDKIKQVKSVLNKHKDKNGTYVKANLPDNTSMIFNTRIKLSIDFIIDMENVVGKENIITEDI